VLPISDASPIAIELTFCDILVPTVDIPAILVLFPPGNGIGIYCGAFIASFPISSPNHLIGATAASVILLAPRAVITVIQRITRARTFIIIVPITPFPRSRAFEPPDFTAGSKSPCVVNVIPLSPQNLNSVIPPGDVISTISDFRDPFPVLSPPVAHITSPRNMSPNARAAETYTGTIASEINSLIVNFSSFFALSPRTKVSAKIGENIA